jgi:hypothetical protein
MENRRRNLRSSNSEAAQLEDTSLTPTIRGSEADAGSHNERIARRAYQRYEERGRDDGWDQEDWFEAERELLSDRPKE